MTEFTSKTSIENRKSKIENPKLVWLTENYPPQRGGMAVSCDRIVRSLRENGVEIDVAHFSRRYPRWKIEQKIGGKQIACPVREDIAHALNRLWILIENNKYTHIVAFGGLLPMTASPVYAKWLDAPLVTLIRGNDFDAGIFSLKRGDILREALKNSNAICAVSQDKVEKISRLYPDKKVVWTPNGIDFNDWEFSTEDKRLAINWRKANVTENRCVLGFFGQLKRKKGGLFFLENLLRSGLADKFHLLFVGEAEAEMHEWLEANRDKINFTNLEFLDRYELLPFYAACDFVVVPSFYDGMPNVLLEAAALGVPALASDAGGMRDILRDGETAFLFKAGDEHNLRRAIEKATKLDENDWQILKDNCVALAKQFNHRAEAEKYLQVFNEISNKRSLYAEK